MLQGVTPGSTSGRRTMYMRPVSPPRAADGGGLPFACQGYRLSRPRVSALPEWTIRRSGGHAAADVIHDLCRTAPLLDVWPEAGRRKVPAVRVDSHLQFS